jgi:hypothetical protein
VVDRVAANRSLQLALVPKTNVDVSGLVAAAARRHDAGI